jgi:hypothetical protein
MIQLLSLVYFFHFHNLSPLEMAIFYVANWAQNDIKINWMEWTVFIVQQINELNCYGKCFVEQIDCAVLEVKALMIQ